MSAFFLYNTAEARVLWTDRLLLLSNTDGDQLSRTASNLSIAKVISQSNNQLAHGQ